MARAEINLNQADKYTDSQLDSIVAHLDYVYRKAYKEMKEKRDDCFSSFLKADKQKQKLVESGDWTEEQYKQWKLGWINQSNKMASLINDYARKATEANQTASEYINSKTPEIFAYNHNFTAYEFEKNSGISFSIIDKNVVKELATGRNHSEFRTLSVDKKATYNWNKEKIQRELTAGIIQGKSIPKIANDFYKIMGSNKKASVRNARTAVTSAQNGGRQQGFNQAQALGINFKKKWLSAHDDRVRDSHAELNGEMVDPDKPFSNGLMYPSDPKGEPKEVYNCRCTMRAVIEKAKKTDVGSFELWEMFKANDLKKAIVNTIENVKIWNYANKNSVSFNELPDNMRTDFMEGLKKSSPSIRKVLKYSTKNARFVIGEESFTLSTPVGEKYVFLDKNCDSQAIAHELMHWFDEKYGLSSNLTSAIEKDKAVLSKYAKDNGETELETLKRLFPYAFNKSGSIKRKYASLSDVFDGLYDGKFEMKYHHAKDYWDDDEKINKEIVANYSGTEYGGDARAIHMFETVFYETSKQIKEELEKHGY